MSGDDLTKLVGDLIARVEAIEQALTPNGAQARFTLLTELIVQSRGFNDMLRAVLKEVFSEAAIAESYMRAVPLIVADGGFEKLMMEGVERVLEIFAGRVEEIIATRPALLTNAEAAKFLRRKPKTLTTMRHEGKGPKWSGSGKDVRYEMVDLLIWQRSLPALTVALEMNGAEKGSKRPKRQVPLRT